MTLRSVFRLIDFGFAVAQAAVRTYDRAKRFGRALLPRRREDAFNLSRRAQHRDCIVPPPPKE